MRTLNQINVLFPQPVMKWHSVLTPYVFYALTRILVCHHRGHNKGKRTSGAPIGSTQLTHWLAQSHMVHLAAAWACFHFIFLFFKKKQTKKNPV